MNSYYANLLVDVAPGLTIVGVALAAAFPPYAIMCQPRKGRARGAIAYILGFFAGVALTMLVMATVAARFPEPSVIFAAGIVASFFAPFGGMVRAKLRKPVRRQPRGAAIMR